MNRLGVLVTAAATCLFFKGGAAEETCWEQESSTDTCTEGCWFDDGWIYDTCETCSSGSDDPNNECDVGQQSGYSPNCYVMDSSSVGCCSGFRESGISINGVVHCIRNGMDDQLNGGTRDGLYCGSQSSFTNVCNMPSAPASSSSSPSEETCWEQESGTGTCPEGCWLDYGWTYDTCETCSSGSDDPNNECDVGQQSGFSPNCYIMDYHGNESHAWTFDSSPVGCCSGFRESGVLLYDEYSDGFVHCIRKGMDDQIGNGGTRDGLKCGSQSSFANVCNMPEEDKCMGETKKVACRKISGCLWEQGVCQMAASEPADVCMAETKAGKCRKTSGCLWKNGECVMVADEQTDVCVAETKARKCRKISGCLWKNGECLMVADEQTDLCMAETKKGKCRKISGCFWEQGECHIAASEPVNVCMSETKAGKCRKISGCSWKKGQCFMDDDEE